MGGGEGGFSPPHLVGSLCCNGPPCEEELRRYS
jgi:hypothetical protein